MNKNTCEPNSRDKINHHVHPFFHVIDSSMPLISRRTCVSDVQTVSEQTAVLVTPCPVSRATARCRPMTLCFQRISSRWRCRCGTSSQPSGSLSPHRALHGACSHSRVLLLAAAPCMEPALTRAYCCWLPSPAWSPLSLARIAASRCGYHRAASSSSSRHWWTMARPCVSCSHTVRCRVSLSSWSVRAPASAIGTASYSFLIITRRTLTIAQAAAVS